MVPPIYTLEKATLSGHDLALGPLDWEIAATGVTVLLGPAGTGKSTLLRALAGRLEHGPWTIGGRWRLGGDEITERLVGNRGLPAVAFSPQRRRNGPLRRWDEALPSVSSLRAVLLDEPDRAGDQEPAALVERLRALGEKTAVILITHDLGFARQVGDHACLIAAGRIVARQPMEEFFERPASVSGAHFVRDGNCWPAPMYEPPLPSHVHWIIPGRLAGMAYPGLLGAEDDELEAIARAGIEILLSTTPEAFARQRLRAFGIEGRHLPIKDMGVPALRNVASVCAELSRAMDAGRGVAVHCKAGLGRTGLVLASILVWRGASARDAIARVRHVSPMSIQTPGQELFVVDFAESLGR